MSYRSICHLCAEEYNGTEKDDALRAHPEYIYDPTDFTCKDCIQANLAVENEMLMKIMEEITCIC